MDDRLYKFARLVEIGSFTRAARELHISQPALSVAVQKLEHEFKTLLLIRTGKRLKLTPAGKAVYQAALDHQDTANRLRTSLNRLAKKRPSVVIGMTDSIANQLCHSPAFDALEQVADVTVIVNNSRYLRQEVERRKLDIAFTIDDESDHDELLTEHWGIEELLLVCSARIEDQIRTALEQRILRSFISYDKPSTTYRHIHRYFSQIGLHTSTSLFSTSPDVMLGMVRRGKGVAALPAPLVEPFVNSGELAVVSGPIRRPIALIRLPKRPLPPYLKEFIRHSA